LSARYSASPALRLRIGKSRLRAALHGVLCLVTAYSLWSLFAHGYTRLPLILTPPVASLLWCLRSDPMLGAELCWRQGLWTLKQAGVERVIFLSRRSSAMPWWIYLGFTGQPAGPAGHIWLYVDSASRQQLRLLRVRLTLQR
jgi:hypothetical protein